MNLKCKQRERLESSKMAKDTPWKPKHKVKEKFKARTSLALKRVFYNDK